MTENSQGDTPRIIKKYQNRRLYDTQESIYITLQDVKELAMAGVDFVVNDATNGNDITRQVLLAIILEEESDGVPIFSDQLLRQIISFYGHTFQSALGRYLEGNIRQFADAQSQIQEQMKKLMPHTDDPTVVFNKLASMPTPMMSNFFGSYAENSKKMFELMTESFNVNALGANNEAKSATEAPLRTPNLPKPSKSRVTTATKPKKNGNIRAR